MRQTSIDWLIDQLTYSKELYDDQGYANPKVWEELLAQAKAMHKEEIIDAWKDAEGYNDENAVILAKQYYNETYKGGQDGC